MQSPSRLFSNEGGQGSGEGRESWYRSGEVDGPHGNRPVNHNDSEWAACCPCIIWQFE
jgi:hypothetical protein